MQAVIENSDSSSSSNDVNTLIDSDVKHKIIKWYLTSYENTPLSMPLNQHRALLQPYRRIANLLKKLTLSDFMIKSVEVSVAFNVIVIERLVFWGYILSSHFRRNKARLRVS